MNSDNSATDDKGKANCNTGQFGYAVGPISDGVRYKNDELGGHLGIVNDRFPVRVPTTFTGVPSLKKVDSGVQVLAEEGSLGDGHGKHHRT